MKPVLIALAATLAHPALAHTGPALHHHAGDGSALPLLMLLLLGLVLAGGAAVIHGCVGAGAGTRAGARAK
ncbi:hypothetical protein [Roseivivax sp. CAU 1753]